MNRKNIIGILLICSISSSMACFADTQDKLSVKWNQSIDSVSIMLFRPKSCDKLAVHMNRDSVGITFSDIDGNISSCHTVHCAQDSLLQFVDNLFITQQVPVYISNEHSPDSITCTEFDWVDVNIYSNGTCINKYHIEGFAGHHCDTEWLIWDRWIMFSCEYVAFRNLLYELINSVRDGKPKIHNVIHPNNTQAKDAARHQNGANTKPIKHSSDKSQKTHSNSFGRKNAERLRQWGGIRSKTAQKTIELCI